MTGKGTVKSHCSCKPACYEQTKEHWGILGRFFYAFRRQRPSLSLLKQLCNSLCETQLFVSVGDCLIFGKMQRFWQSLALSALFGFSAKRDEGSFDEYSLEMYGNVTDDIKSSASFLVDEFSFIYKKSHFKSFELRPNV